MPGHMARMVSWRRQFVDAYLRWAGVPGDARYDALMNALVDVMYTGSRHFGSLGLPLPRPIPAETLRRIQAPTLLLYGDREKMHRPDAAVTFARAHVARLEPHVLTDASHDLTLRQPGAVDQAIASFLTRRVESP